MSNPVENLIIKATNAFKLRPGEGESPDAFITALTNLQNYVRSVSPEDLKLADAVKLIPTSTENQKSLAFFPIFENLLISIVVIVMKPAGRIPFHDHPNMYGLMKVLSGQIRVKTYTLLDQPVKLIDPEKSTPMSALQQPETILTKDSHPILLTPSNGNVHEVECTSGESKGAEYAAFLDILSPPYSATHRGNYFKAEEGSQRTEGSGDYPARSLIQIKCPKDYPLAIVALDHLKSSFKI